MDKKDDTSRAALTGFSEKERALALDRFRLIKPVLEHGAALSDAIAGSDVSIRTARRWLRNYRKSGLLGLIRRRRGDIGSPKVDETLRQFVEGLALRVPRQSIASIHRQSIQFAEQGGHRAPAYTTVRRMVCGIEEPLRCLAHEGRKSFVHKYDLVYRRTAAHPNEIWQADHTELDILVIDDRGKPRRPWLTAILDDYSRAVCGYMIGLDAPSAINTALALHQAIWRKPDSYWHVCGIPDKFYTDHGSDFTSKHMEQVSADIKMQLIFSTVGEPRGRGKMERFFRTVNQLFLSALPGYTHGGGSPKAQLSLSELDCAFKKWVIDHYLVSNHSETNETPQLRWERARFLPRMPESLHQLDLLLLTVARSRKVHPDGIHFQGFRYLSSTLAAYVQEPVTIRYDPRDLAQIRVFHQDTFLCIATCPELSGATINLKDIVRARNQRRRELNVELKEKRSIVDRFISVHQTSKAPSASVVKNAKRVRSLKEYEND